MDVNAEADLLISTLDEQPLSTQTGVKNVEFNHHHLCCLHLEPNGLSARVRDAF